MSKAKETFVKGLQFNAKVVAALKRAYVERLNSREIPPDTTFKKYFEQNAGGVLPDASKPWPRCSTACA